MSLNKMTPTAKYSLFDMKLFKSKSNMMLKKEISFEYLMNLLRKKPKIHVSVGKTIMKDLLTIPRSINGVPRQNNKTNQYNMRH